jgi:hypothetical protein
MNIPKKPRPNIPSADLPKEYLEAIGEVTVNWGHFCNLVEVAIWGILGLTVRQGTALTAPIFFLPRLNMLQSVGNQYFEGKPEQQAFKDLHTKIANTYSERNKIEHALWHQVHPAMPVTRSRVLKTTKVVPEFFQVTQIQDFSDTIVELFNEFNAFMEAHIPPPAIRVVLASPRKQPEQPR